MFPETTDWSCYAADIAECKQECSARGFGAFCVLSSTAFFKRQPAEECSRALRVEPNATTYLFHPTGAAAVVAAAGGKPAMMDKADAKVCFCCKVTVFSALVRKHNCRFCLRVVCNGCSKARVTHPG